MIEVLKLASAYLLIVTLIGIGVGTLIKRMRDYD